MATPADAAELMSVVTARWTTQSLYVATKHELFEHIPEAPASVSADELAAKLGLQAPFVYRLLRLVTTAGVLTLNKDRTFSLTPKGKLMRKDHPMSLAGVLLLEESLYHRRGWEHLDHIVKNGSDQTGFQLAHGKPWLDLLMTDGNYRTLFDAAMKSFTGVENQFALEAYDWKSVKTVADIGGNQGQLLCALAAANPHLTGYVLDIPPVVAASHVPQETGTADRIRLVPGDFFMPDQIEPVDVYIMKHVLHDWDDAACIKILQSIHKKSPAHARLVNFDFLIPNPGEPDNGSLGLDVHMMAVVTGKDREEEEMRELYEKGGWKLVRTVKSPGPLAMTEAVKI
ncbi:hypothetical protein HDU96_003820 [Phlyctochytrium bullatum]|nr:hypothetical protein HDU96_003820 [Phlyctochytrium bullatum]